MQQLTLSARKDNLNKLRLNEISAYLFHTETNFVRKQHLQVFDTTIKYSDSDAAYIVYRPNWNRPAFEVHQSEKRSPASDLRGYNFVIPN